MLTNLFTVRKLTCLPFIFLTLFIVSCAVQENAIILEPSPGFDESQYLDPEEYGGEPAFLLDVSEENSDNDSFTPITIKGGYDNAIQRYASRSAMRSRREGGATFQVYVDSTGTVTKIEMTKMTSSAVANTLERVARNSVYNPAILNGKPVNSYRQMELYNSITTRTTTQPRSY